jgi:hypothetical protein
MAIHNVMRQRVRAGEKRIQGELSQTREGALGYMELRKTFRTESVTLQRSDLRQNIANFNTSINSEGLTFVLRS